MPLTAPCKTIDFRTTDIYEEPVDLRKFRGRKVLLAFFRDAACPFCNLRLYELSRDYDALQASGLEVIAVFSSTKEEIKQFVARHPRPFTMLSDPNLELYQRYGIQHSGSAMLKAMLLHPLRIIRGMLKGGTGDMNNPHVKLVPADFLIAENGEIRLAWYGRNTSDHIPMKTIKQFAGKPLFKAAVG